MIFLSEQYKRSIVHMDLDSFFVSVSRLMHPGLNGKAVLVGSGSDRGVVAACSYEARKFGIHSAMPMKIARRLCPEAIIIRGDYEEYSKRSDEVTQIIKESVPLYERASIDEFYMDLTGMDKFFGCYKWASELRVKIRNQTGLPISFGMSQNKTVSKVATDEAKPDSQLKIDHGNEKTFLAPLSVKKIPMIGEKTYTLLRSMGVEKVKTLQDMPIELLQNVLGENGGIIWRKANGIDNVPVEPYSEQKSISTEETFDSDTIDVSMLKNMLIAMTEKLCFRLRSDNKLTSCITVKIRYSNFDTHTMQCRLSYTSCDHTLIAKVKELFDKLFNRRMLIRLIGVRLSHLVGGGYQVNLFEDSEAIINLYQAMDKMRLIFGEDAVHRAVALNYSLRTFNPFNGITNTSSQLYKSENGNDLSMKPSIKNMNKLLNIKKNKPASSQSSFLEMPAKGCEYLLLIYPPKVIYNEIKAIKKRFESDYNHEQATKSEPHITLINFLLAEREEEQVIKNIGEVNHFTTPFEMVLKNFCIHTHAIYINIEYSAPISDLVKSLHLKLNLQSSQSFFALKPHITIAKGLSEEKFNKVLNKFQEAPYTASFIADHMLLMKRESAFERFLVIKEFEFSCMKTVDIMI